MTTNERKHLPRQKVKLSEGVAKGCWTQPALLTTFREQTIPAIQPVLVAQAKQTFGKNNHAVCASMPTEHGWISTQPSGWPSSQPMARLSRPPPIDKSMSIRFKNPASRAPESRRRTSRANPQSSGFEPEITESGLVVSLKTITATKQKRSWGPSRCRYVF